MFLAAAIFLFLFADEFFMQEPYAEWYAVALGFAVTALGTAIRPFVPPGLTTVVPTVLLAGAVLTLAGFAEAYRRSAGGLL
ncbi:MAG: hypothetical protein SV186_00845 [Candidatus Nanohaloarchaea archaeon]|nr:hypothetical protein [Candidatus Nanohaloarchaea archaeon]